MAGEYQTRDEDGALHHWSSVSEAIAEAKNHPEIWKISWTDGNTGERIRLIRRVGLTPKGDNHPGEMAKTDDVWVYEPIVLPEVPSSERR